MNAKQIASLKGGGKALRAALAAALALMVCIPIQPLSAMADTSDANDAVVHIHSYKIDNGDDNMNGGVCGSLKSNTLARPF